MPHKCGNIVYGQPHHVPLQVKGPDRARYHVGDGVNEIQDYLQARYVDGFLGLCITEDCGLRLKISIASLPGL